MNVFKKCYICKTIKSVELFYKKGKGYRSECSDCSKKSTKEWREKNPEKMRRQFLRWKSQHPGHLEKWRLSNKKRLSDYNKALYYKNPQKIKDNTLKRLFGFTLEEYNKLLIEQNNVCAICLNPETQKHQKGTVKNLSVDHDHKTGQIRGLLCYNCNIGLGKFKDNKELLIKASLYLEKSIKEEKEIL